MSNSRRLEKNSNRSMHKDIKDNYELIGVYLL